MAATRVELSLSTEALAQPEVVANWLQLNANTADRAAAQYQLQQAQLAEQAGDWSAVAQALSESARHFPAPATLVAYAEARLHELANRSAKPDATMEQDALSRIGNLYQSALAANRVLSVLSDQALQTLTSQANCLDAYLAKRPVQTPCRPLQIYQKQ
ncbi:hypothetical protein [Chitinivorax sp. B]|uniref:hypothetical protein n=1 Tax=Chitinivorax sp. B TaxID=2502235 RepID=UPI0010F7C92F|nr:hypothetical protein [Chitinivorax sp. B]